MIKYYVYIQIEEVEYNKLIRASHQVVYDEDCDVSFDDEAEAIEFANKLKREALELTYDV